MKKFMVLVFTLALASALTACGGGNSSSAATSASSAADNASSADAAASSEAATAEASSAEAAASAEEPASAATLEEYFDAHPSTETLFLSGFETEFENTEGLDGGVEVKGNDVILTMDFTGMYTEAGVTDATLVRSALEETGVESVQASVPQLVEMIQNVEQMAGINGVRLIYYYVFNGEQVYELSVDSEGNVASGAEVAAAA